MDNYECEGQMELTDWLKELDSKEPCKCCGVTPWLVKTKCCHWDNSTPQMYMMHYQCPKCLKVAADNTGWTIYSHGMYEDAAADALKAWNDPKAIFKVNEYPQYVHASFGEYEDFEKLYGISYEDYSRPIIDKLNEEFRRKQHDRDIR